ncbi:MAG: GC-type dockerin domain-anchored protein [Phycisphaerales bacterium]
MRDRVCIRRLAATLLPLLGICFQSHGQPCVPLWSDQFASGAIEGKVYALAMFDPDGPGGTPSNLVAAGNFTTAGGMSAPRVAGWDGRRWQPMSTGPAPGQPSRAQALAVFDPDGAGPVPPRLFAAVSAGSSTSSLWSWDGSSWAVPSTVIGTIYSMAVFDDDGPGPHTPALVVGGTITSAGGVPFSNIAKWDGTTWTSLGGGITGSQPNSPVVSQLALFDADGDGPQPGVLAACGAFDVAGGFGASGFAVWNGSTWSNLGFFRSEPKSIAGHDEDGPGPLAPRLYVAGGGAFPPYVVRLDGSAWTQIGSGGAASAMASFDADGAGPQLPQLYVGTGVTTPGGSANAGGISRWDGASWSALGTGLDTTGSPREVLCLAAADFGSGTPTLAVGGGFQLAGPLVVGGIASWDGQSWHAPGNGIGGYVNALAEYDPDGAGPQPASILVVGKFASAGDVASRAIVAWTGTTFTSFGGGITAGLSGPNDAEVKAIAVFDEDGAGPSPPSVIVGGNISSVGGVSVSNIARWNGSAWSAIGAGFNGRVTCLAVFNDGTGAALYAGGLFRFSATTPIDYLAKWNGTSWQAVSQSQSQWLGARSLAVFDADGSGPLPAELIAGHGANTSPAPYIWRWNGTTWSGLGSGLNQPADSLAVLDADGPGPGLAKLYVGGFFTIAGGVNCNRLATWNGVTWSAVGVGVQNGLDRAARTIAGLDADGPGPSPWSVFAGGDFSIAGNQTISAFARFDGATWSAVAGGLTDPVTTYVNAQLVFDDDGAGPRLPGLYVGGEFSAAGATPSRSIARWGCPLGACYANCDGSSVPPILNISDFSCFINRYANGEPYANCDGSTVAPVFNILDFQCFLNNFAQGCP